MQRENLTERLVLQRIRNRIIEYLSLASSPDEQLAYQQRVPHVHVPNEIFNQWEDWVHEGWQREFVEPIFSPDEQDAIATFQGAWESVSRETPDPLPALDPLLDTPPWRRLQHAAADALRVFAKRGSLPEDAEVS